jgi:parallel beta-helix repeat protein
VCRLGWQPAEVQYGGVGGIEMNAGRTGRAVVLSGVLAAVVSASAGAQVAPTNTSPPAVSGTAQEGQTLTLTAGQWSGDPAPTLTEQWQRCDASGGNCADIGGATGSTYLLVAADVGQTVRVVETATNDSGSASQESAVTTVVTAAASAPVNGSPPVVSGTAQQGQTLTLTAGQWSGSPAPTLTEQWQRCDAGGAGCVDIPGATASTYVLLAEDVGHTVKVAETATNDSGSASEASAATPVVTAAAPAGPLQVCADATYTTIQAAIDAAASGDTIDVCAGTFPEQLVIGKSLTLVGAGRGKTTIAAPSPLGGTQDIVTIAGSGVRVDLSGFTITGPGPTGDCSGLLSGVFVRDGASATIHGNEITAIRENPLDSCQKGAGIRVGRAALSTSGSASISGNTITDYQKTGIVVDGAGSNATISNNTIGGVGSTDQLAQNGIQISRNASASVSGNDISGNSYSKSPESTGILLYGDLGDVTVSGNTVHGNDVNISLSTVNAKGKVTVDGNTISAGSRGIALDGTTGTLIRDNTVSGADRIGLWAGSDTTGNTFDGNQASGASGAGAFDCRDESQGDQSAGTKNSWTGNTGAVASPDGICSPKPASGSGGATTPTPPPVEVDAPNVIVLPPAPPGETKAELTNPKQPAQPAQPAGPVVQAAANEVVTRMKKAEMKTCLITVVSRGRHNVLIARGLAHAPPGGRGTMLIRLGVQPKGQLLLASTFGGVPVDVRAACRTTSNGSRVAIKAARAVLLIEHVVTTPGSWVPDQAVLTPTGTDFLDRLRAKMIAIVGYRCDGYTATWPPSPADPPTLSLERAKVACARLRRSDVEVQPRLFGHGTARPIATNDTETGRAANRRVAVTFVHLIAHRTSRT